jgi:predicted Zn-ribbon and HTH transcriptional regulator
MKYLKKFESEIQVGTWQHYNSLRPVNNQLFDKNPLFSFQCDDCGFEFATEEKEQNWCSVCLSKNINKTKFDI